MNRKHKLRSFSPRLAAIAGAATVAAAGAGAFGVPAAGAATNLPVSFAASGDGASVHYNPAGDIVLTPGSPASSTFAQMNVDLGALRDSLAPSAPPSFTTDNYAAGSPRWVIELANGNFIDGYPSQLGGTAAGDFTGNQWAVGNSGTYESYQKALDGANDPLNNVQVTDAYIVADGDQASGTPDTLTNVQYDGDSPAAGTAVTVSPIAKQSLTAGKQAPDVQVQASTTSVPDTTLTYGATGLPDGLSIDQGTGVISGTPTTIGTSTATVTVTDAYGDTGSTQIPYTIAPATICSGACSWERLKAPSSMVMDVWGYTPALNRPIIAYNAKGGDPTADFTMKRSGTGSSWQIAYTPYSTRATAEALKPSLAAEAYNADGSPKYCVSSIADKSGQAARLRYCATGPNQWQDFLSVSRGSYRELEPTYGQAGVSAGRNPMALNDKGYGGNGTPLINYAAIGSANEEFIPGL